MNRSTTITLGITTKNRPVELFECLSRIEPYARQLSEIFITDDGSTPPIEVPSSIGGVPIRLFRNSTSIGYISARNRMVKACSTTCYLSLDDDSFPVEGDLMAAADWLISNPNAGALSFPYTEGTAGAFRNPSRSQIPYQVQAYTGCAHLLSVQQFLDARGYGEWMIHQGEEGELALRWLHQGVAVFHYPGLRIHHQAVATSRSWDRMAFYGTRNRIVVALVYYPYLIAGAALFKICLLALMKSLKERRMAFIRGIFSGISDGLKRIGTQTRLTTKQFRNHKSLPSA